MFKKKWLVLEERQQKWAQEIFTQLDKMPMEQAQERLLKEIKGMKNDLEKVAKVGENLDRYRKFQKNIKQLDSGVVNIANGTIAALHYLFAILKEIALAKTLAEKERWINKMEDFAKNFESYHALAQNFYFMDAKNLLELTDRVDAKELADRAPKIVEELENSFQAIAAETSFDQLDNYAKAANFILEYDTASGLDRENAVIAMDFANAMFDAGLDKDDLASLKLLNQYIMDNEINYTPDMELTRDIVANFLEEVAKEKEKNQNEKQKEPERAL